MRYDENPPLNPSAALRGNRSDFTGEGKLIYIGRTEDGNEVAIDRECTLHIRDDNGCLPMQGKFPWTQHCIAGFPIKGDPYNYYEQRERPFEVEGDKEPTAAPEDPELPPSLLALDKAEPTDALMRAARAHDEAEEALGDVPDPGLAENPKEAIGMSKPPTSVLPWPVLMQVGRARSDGRVPALAALHVPTLYLVALGLAEGALKYGRHNYRVVGSILASVYFDATGRHIDALLVGQDTDPDSGLYHGIKAICSTVVLYDAILKGTFNDDRPPKQSYLFVDDCEGDDTLLTYCGQAKRSMAAWWEGGDRENLIDALVFLFALCESEYEGTLIDDRTARAPDFMEDIQTKLDAINERVPPEKRLPAWSQKRVEEEIARAGSGEEISQPNKRG